MNKTDLIQKIKQLEGISQDERSYLINLVNTKKKYGLVWEDKPEDVEEQLRTQLPVLREVVEKRILAKDLPQPEKQPETKQATLFDNNDNPDNADNNDNQSEAPNHILIEGDNLHALTALTFTHESQIDVMYFDPPYNTGNKDFKYNDSFVDKVDSYRHSKWLSFMHKRLEIAKRLLSDKGVIFISIDDNEQSQLKLLCDEIFGISCHVATLPVVMNLKGNQDKYGFSDTHEYCIVYTKQYQTKEFGYFKIDEEDVLNDWLEDDYGLYKKADGLRATGVNAPREKRRNLYYPIFINPETEEFYTSEDNLPRNKEDIELWPINEENEELSWYWKKSNVNDFNHNLILTRARGGGYSIYKKQRPAIGDIPTKKPKTIFYKPEYSTSSSTTELKKMFGFKIFNAPKPVPFLVDLLAIGLPNNGIVLDIFAGSGTTLHATMQLNAEDGGNRQCIMVTNNENNICEEVTYERNRRVIQGYTNSKGEWVSGLTNNNLRYYKSEFVGREPSLKNKRELTRLATELLCIKEDCYQEQEIAIKQAKLFTNGKVMLLVLFDDHIIPDAVKFINKQINGIILKVYVFSMGSDPYTEDFYEVSDKIELCALPDAIYKAYHQVLPKNKRFIIDDDEKIEEEMNKE